jgi:MFS family permease
MAPRGGDVGQKGLGRTLKSHSYGVRRPLRGSLSVRAGFVLASGFISLVLFLLVGAMIGDRLPRKRVLIGSDMIGNRPQAWPQSLLFASVRCGPFLVASGLGRP